MKLFQQLLILGLCFTTNVALAAPASDQQVQQLLKVMSIDKILNDTIQQIRPQLDQQAYQIVKMMVKKDQLSPQEQIIANELSDKLYAQSKKIISWDQMKPLYQKIYKEVYDADEVKALIEFYSSAVGQSILKKTPLVAQETMTITSSRLMSSMQTTETDFKEFNQKLASLKKAEKE